MEHEPEPEPMLTNVSSEPATNNERENRLPYFPADVQEAKKIVDIYRRVYEESAVLRKATEGNQEKKILCCAVGLMPETGYFWGAGFSELQNDEEREELRRIYEEKLGLKVLNWPGRDPSILNPRAIEKVIKNCPIPALFPSEAKEDPVGWVMQNPGKWEEISLEGSNPQEVKKRTAIFGILSGYPPHGSAVFSTYQTAMHSIKNVWDQKDEQTYHEYVYSNPDERVFPKRLKEKIEKAVQGQIMTREQADLIRCRFIPKWDDIHGIFGDGFCDEDKKYFDNLRSFGRATLLDLSCREQLFMEE